MEAIRAAVRVTATSNSAPIFIENGMMRLITYSQTVLIEINLSNEIDSTVSLSDAKPLLKAYDAMESPQVTFAADEITMVDEENGQRFRIGTSDIESRYASDRTPRLPDVDFKT